MANLTIEMPDELAHRLAGIAATHQKSLQQFAVDHLTSLAVAAPAAGPGSAAMVLQAMHGQPHLSASLVDELDAAIAAARLPIRESELFPE